LKKSAVGVTVKKKQRETPEIELKVLNWVKSSVAQSGRKDEERGEGQGSNSELSL